MKKHKLYLIDLDGTIYNGNNVIEYAVDFINYLNENNIDYLFITNNSTKTELEVVSKLKSMGIKTYEQNIFTSSEAASLYLKSKSYNNVSVIGEAGLKNTLLKNNINIVDENPEALVVGLDRNVNYDILSKACNYILSGVEFIATNPDKLIPTENGMNPSNGAQVKFLEYCTDVIPTIIGKPSNIIMDLAIKKFNYDKSEIAMVGDNYETDILSGINSNIDTIHVQTGVTSKEQIEKKSIQPTYTLKNLKELLENISDKF